METVLLVVVSEEEGECTKSERGNQFAVGPPEMVLAVIDPLPSETSRPGNEDRGTESRHACSESDACRKRQTSRSTSHALTATHERILPRSGTLMRTQYGRCARSTFVGV
jgi:hypothetical protein